MGEGFARHIPDNEHWKHVPTEGGTENGACLFHWNGAFPSTGKETSCHYRWQAKKETRGHIKAIYRNYPLAREKAPLAERGIASPFLTQNGAAAQAYGERLALPKERGEWDLDGPPPGRRIRKGKTSITAGKNFTDWRWPYWHNAHHLIPKGTFAKTMMEIRPDDIRDLVVAGLFRAPYNINHMKNILILPMDMEVGMLLQLPRHLSRDEGSEVDDPVPFFNHVQYNRLVKEGMDDAIDEFVRAAHKARDGAEECKAIEAIKLSRAKLEELSSDCVSVITDWGAAHPGQPLVDMDLG